MHDSLPTGTPLRVRDMHKRFGHFAALDGVSLDIEGGEIDALKGAERIIREGRPVICLSLYHKPDDLWRIPLLLASMVDDYAFHIRQHMFNSFDSVLYAVPKSR